MGIIREIRTAKQPGSSPVSQQSGWPVSRGETALLAHLEAMITEFETGEETGEQDQAVVETIFELYLEAPCPPETFTLHVAWAACSFARAALMIYHEGRNEAVEEEQTST
jgi:hypothetical protein